MSLLAHVGQPIAPHDLAGAWNLDPTLLAALAGAAWLYGRGLSGLWRSAGAGAVVDRRRAGAFACGLAVLAVALVSPLDAASGVLFSAHMVQHLLLVLVAPPLLVLGVPQLVMARGLPPSGRRRAGRWLGKAARIGRRASLLPVVGLAVFAVVLWAWHVPALYDAAVRHDVVHIAEHVTLLAAALWFWSPVIRPRRTPTWAGALLLFGASLQSGILAALLTFSSRPWFDVHVRSAAVWGLSPLQDQQLAGVIMWVPGGVLYLVVAAAVFMRWLDEDERAALRPAQLSPTAMSTEGVGRAPHRQRA